MPATAFVRLWCSAGNAHNDTDDKWHDRRTDNGVDHACSQGDDHGSTDHTDRDHRQAHDGDDRYDNNDHYHN